MEPSSSTQSGNQKPQGQNRRSRNRGGKGKKAADAMDVTGVVPGEGSKLNRNDKKQNNAAGPSKEGSKPNVAKPVVAAAAPSNRPKSNKPDDQKAQEAAGQASNDGTKPKRRNRNRKGKNPVEAGAAASANQDQGPSGSGSGSGSGRKAVETAGPANNATRATEATGPRDNGASSNDRKTPDQSGPSTKELWENYAKNVLTPVNPGGKNLAEVGGSAQRGNRGGRGNRGRGNRGGRDSRGGKGKQPADANSAAASTVVSSKKPRGGGKTRGKGNNSRNKPGQQPAGFRLMDLPLEIRQQIYRLCIPSGYVFDVRKEDPIFAGPPPGEHLPFAMTFLNDPGYYGIDSNFDDYEEWVKRNLPKRKSRQVARGGRGRGGRGGRGNGRGGWGGRGRDVVDLDALFDHMAFDDNPYVDAYMRGRQVDSDGMTIDSDDSDYLGRMMETGFAPDFVEDSDDFDEFLRDFYEDFDEDSDEDLGANPDLRSVLRSLAGEARAVSGPFAAAARAAAVEGATKAEVYNDVEFVQTSHLTQSRLDTYAEPTVPHPKWQGAVEGLLLTSRQVREEVLDILYGENVFRFVYGDTTDEDWIIDEAPFPKKKLFRIKHLMLVFDAGMCGEEGFNEKQGLGYGYGSRTWGELLQKIKSLRLVVEAPDVAAEPSKGEPYDAGEVKRCATVRRLVHETWIQEASPLLKYLGRTVSPEAKILADVDEMKVVSGVLNTALGRDWKHIRTTTGDELHKRVDVRMRKVVADPDDIYEYGPSQAVIRRVDYREWLDQTFEDAPRECDCSWHNYDE